MLQLHNPSALNQSFVFADLLCDLFSPLPESCERTVHGMQFLGIVCHFGEQSSSIENSNKIRLGTMVLNSEVNF